MLKRVNYIYDDGEIEWEKLADANKIITYSETQPSSPQKNNMWTYMSSSNNFSATMGRVVGTSIFQKAASMTLKDSSTNNRTGNLCELWQYFVGSATSGQTIFTIHKGYRPIGDIVAFVLSNSNLDIVPCKLTSAGKVIILGDLAEGTWSLRITYLAEPLTQTP